MSNKNSIRYIVRNADGIFKSLRWKRTIRCPYCGGTHVYLTPLPNQKVEHYKCGQCKKRFTPFTNTIMHGTNLDTAAWLLVLYLMLDSRGISSYEISRKVGVTQKTAWKMMMKWRLAMSQNSVELSGVVAMDEVYLGGKWGNKTLRKQQELIAQFLPAKYCRPELNKNAFLRLNALIHTPVFAMNDGERVVIKVLPHEFTRSDLQRIFNEHTGNVTTCVSDCSKLYNDWEIEFEHNNHSKKQFTTPNGYSSNCVEGLFSHLVRSLNHVQVHISRKYMQLYLDELSFRWRHRLDNIHIKMKDTFINSNQRPNIDSVSIKEKPQEDWFDPEEFFNTYGTVVSKVEHNGIIYSNPK